MNSNMTATANIIDEPYGYLLSYVLDGDTDRTDCLHIAYSLDGKAYIPLNNNRAILYTKNGTKKMGSPSIFRKIDGTYGILASDNNESGYISVWDSKDLITYTNERFILLNDQGIHVKDPRCSYDAKAGVYRICFSGCDGKSYMTTTIDFERFSRLEETSYSKDEVKARKLPDMAAETSRFAVTKVELDKVLKKFTRVTNTSLAIPNVEITVGDTVSLPKKVTAIYSDGSAKSMSVLWDEEQLAKINTSQAGTYQINGNVQQTKYKEILIEERADPHVIYDDQTGYYYFTASYPVRGDKDPEGYDRVILRRSKTIEGLALAEEITIWDEANSTSCFRYIWAPELHIINGKWYVLYTASKSNNNVWDIRPHILACEGDNDPYKPENWIEKGQVKPTAEDSFSFTSFSLDMTYFHNQGKHYLAWAQIQTEPSSIYLATIEPSEPWQLTSKPIRLTKPELAWEHHAGITVNEGPAVLKHQGKVFLCYSAAAVDESYSVGLLSANENSDLMEITSWTKNAYPMLTSDDLVGQYGPGHNSFTIDENGNIVIVYHARPVECMNHTCEFASSSDLNDPHRHARVKNVNYAADGTPILNMTYEEELAPEFAKVSVIVKVYDPN